MPCGFWFALCGGGEKFSLFLSLPYFAPRNNCVCRGRWLSIYFAERTDGDVGWLIAVPNYLPTYLIPPLIYDRTLKLSRYNVDSTDTSAEESAAVIHALVNLASTLQISK